MKQTNVEYRPLHTRIASIATGFEMWPHRELEPHRPVWFGPICHQNPRSEPYSNPFSDSFSTLDFSHLAAWLTASLKGSTGTP
jgi:hypothetical protein